MRTTEQWIDEKVLEYNENPKEALENMLSTTTNIMEQYIKNPNSFATKGVLDACMEHNKLFLQTVGIVQVPLCRYKNCENPTVDMDKLWCKYHDLQING